MLVLVLGLVFLLFLIFELARGLALALALEGDFFFLLDFDLVVDFFFLTTEKSSRLKYGVYPNMFAH